MRKLSIEDVKKVFEDAGCALIGPYENTRTKLRYRCSCGEEAEILFPNFQKGQRCMECSGNKRYTFEYVKEYFKVNDCKLLETEYKNNKTSMRYICSCGKESVITFDSFKNDGARCMDCGGSRKYELQYVKKYFKENGCELLEKTYKNAGTPMKYLCCCGEESMITFSHFNRGVRCANCANNEKRYSLEYVKNYFQENNCVLLEKIYKNFLTRMKYICSCGNFSKISFSSFKNGSRCMNCGNNAKKHTLEYVKKIFEENNCILLEDNYTSCTTKMEYVCSCGDTYTITFSSFNRGVRCKGCGYDKASTSAFTFKDYICPDGEVVRYQGYENLALEL